MVRRWSEDSVVVALADGESAPGPHASAVKACTSRPAASDPQETFIGPRRSGLSCVQYQSAYQLIVQPPVAFDVLKSHVGIHIVATGS